MLKGRATIEGPRQAGWMGQQEPYEIQQGQMPSPTPGVKPCLWNNTGQGAAWQKRA